MEIILQFYYFFPEINIFFWIPVKSKNLEIKVIFSMRSPYDTYSFIHRMVILNFVEFFMLFTSSKNNYIYSPKFHFRKHQFRGMSWVNLQSKVLLSVASTRFKKQINRKFRVFVEG